MIELSGTSPQLTSNVPPVVKWIGYIRMGAVSINATFDLTHLHPSQHELALRVISMGRVSTNWPFNAPKEILLEPRPWWKFWK